MVFIDRLGGPIGRERVGEEARKRGAAGVYLEKWKSFEVEVFLVKERVGDATFVTRNVQVPITPRAIQLMVVGPETQDAELADLARALLASLDGPSNWLSDWERAENLGVVIVKFLAWIVGIGVAVYVLVARRTSVFCGRVVERGLPVALARQKIRPSWAWYLLGAYLFFASICASCWIVVANLISRLEKHQTLANDNSLWYSLGLLVIGSLLASAVTGIVMRRRVKYKRLILATPLPPSAPSESSPE